jgi:hypothetical protein
MSMKAKESTFLEAVIRQQLVKTWKTLSMLQYSNFYSVYTRETVITAYELYADHSGRAV